MPAYRGTGRGAALSRSRMCIQAIGARVIAKGPPNGHYRLQEHRKQCLLQDSGLEEALVILA